MNPMTKSLLVLSACLVLALTCNVSVDEPTAPPLPAIATVPARSTVPPALPAVPTTPAESPGTAPSQPAYGEIAYQHLLALSEDIGPRVAGSREEAQAAEYIANTLEEYGYETEMQFFSFDSRRGESDSANVIAVLPGQSSEEIIVGAHYDSVDDGSGADDNASGVAVLLEVAALLQDAETPYTVRLIAFGAEEVDLDGSRYYVEQMDDREIENTVAMINLDSLIAGDIAYVYGDAGSGSLRDWLLRRASTTNLDLDTRPASDLDEEDGSPCDCADYGPFQEVGIPFAYFESTNWNLGDEDGMTQVDPRWGEDGAIWHTEYDDVDYIDATFPGRIDQRLNLFVTLVYDALTEYE